MDLQQIAISTNGKDTSYDLIFVVIGRLTPVTTLAGLPMSIDGKDMTDDSTLVIFGLNDD